MRERAESSHQAETTVTLAEKYSPRPEFTKAVRIVDLALQISDRDFSASQKPKVNNLGVFRSLAIRAAILVPAVGYFACGGGGNRGEEVTGTFTPETNPTPTRTIDLSPTPIPSPTPELTSTPIPTAKLTPASTPKAEATIGSISAEECLFYTVKNADTLWGIAERFYQDGSKYKLIAARNNITNPRIIHGGQEFCIPGADYKPEEFVNEPESVSPPPVSYEPPPEVKPGGGNKIILTFDDSDGSGGIVTGILDTLAQYNAKAIFFPTGSWAAGGGAPYVERMRNEGHLVCNHTRDHADLSLLSSAGIKDQILGGAGVGSCNLLRPPYGKGCPFSVSYSYVSSVAAELGYEIYCWSIDPRDWAGTSVEYITSTILNNAKPGAVAVLHMHAVNTLYALPGVIDSLQKAGYVVSW